MYIYEKDKKLCGQLEGPQIPNLTPDFIIWKDEQGVVRCRIGDKEFPSEN